MTTTETMQRTESVAASLRRRVGRFLPVGLKRTVRRWLWRRELAANFAYDQRRFAEYSAACPVGAAPERLRSLLVMDAHRIEKALSLRSPRPGFGRATVANLLANLDQYLQQVGSDDTARLALNTLEAYCAFHAGHTAADLDLPGLVAALRTRIEQSDSVRTGAGIVTCRRDEIWEAGRRDLRAFFESRHSIRDFAAEPVPLEQLATAVDLARRTPSVCNRQGWKVHVYSDRTRKAAILECQNGNRGFGEQLAHVLIVTADLSAFVSIGERNQGWIDGGMFAMSLVYALHSLGLGTCCLNCSNTAAEDLRLRATAEIPPSESPIMMIGVGPLPERFRVACSARKEVAELMVVHG